MMININDLEAAALWALYHHQGSTSSVGQPIRKALGMGQFERLTEEQIARARAFAYTWESSCEHTWRPWHVAGEGAICTRCGERDLMMDI